MSVTPEEEAVQEPTADESKANLSEASTDREPTNSPETVREPTNEG